MRVVSWNVAFSGRKTAKRQGDLLLSLSPNLILLQEVNPDSSEVLREAAGADWIARTIDLRTSDPEDSPVRRRGVAIAGRGLPLCRKWLLPSHWWPTDQIQRAQPERILLIKTQTGGTPFVAASYHAPPGVSYKIVKPQQAVAFAAWLSKQNDPLLFGADANTPLIDAVDFSNTRTHWHTGDRRLHGERGDDVLFGPRKLHALEDSLRRWLARNPDEMERLRTSKRSVPLAVTHMTGKRKNFPGTPRRYDSVWVSRHWVVRHIEHYKKVLEQRPRLSDHAPVTVDLDLRPR